MWLSWSRLLSNCLTTHYGRDRYGITYTLYINYFIMVLDVHKYPVCVFESSFDLFKVGTLTSKIWTICQIFHFVWKTVQKGNLLYKPKRHGNWQKNVCSVTWADGFSYSRHVRYLLFPLVVLVRGGVGWGWVSTIHHVSVSPSLRTHTLLVRG